MSNKSLFAEKRSEYCPECGAQLTIRTGKHGYFLGCSRYPACRFIRPNRVADSHVVRELEGQRCPVCHEALVLRQGRYGMFVCCGDYPECGHTENLDKPNTTTIVCPQCRQGHLLQRHSRFGKRFYACERYPRCQFAINTLPIVGECAYCHYPLLIEKKTARGNRQFCASKLCGKPVLNDKLNNE